MPRDHRGVILGRRISPQDIVRGALEAGCATIAYTYTEPTIFFELAYDTAKLATQAGLKNLFVSNGYMTAEALTAIQPFLHAANIDLKGFDDKRHRQLCGATLQPVLDTIGLIKKLGIWLGAHTLTNFINTNDPSFHRSPTTGSPSPGQAPSHPPSATPRLRSPSPPPNISTMKKPTGSTP